MTLTHMEAVFRSPETFINHKFAAVIRNVDSSHDAKKIREVFDKVWGDVVWVRLLPCKGGNIAVIYFSTVRLTKALIMKFKNVPINYDDMDNHWIVSKYEHPWWWSESWWAGPFHDGPLPIVIIGDNGMVRQSHPYSQVHEMRIEDGKDYVTFPEEFNYDGPSLIL